MPTASDQPLPAVGVYWIEEADYPAALAMFEDGATLPPTRAAWLKMAEEMKKGLEGYASASSVRSTVIRVWRNMRWECRSPFASLSRTVT